MSSITEGTQIQKIVDQMFSNGAWKGTMYISPTQIIRITRVLSHGKLVTGTSFNLVVTVGRPNYSEREFIKVCKKAKETFPIKKIQFKFRKNTRN